MTSPHRPQILVFPDLETLSRAAADRIVAAARNAVSAKGRFAVALSGGSTPRMLYALFAAPPYREALDWRTIHIFWVDERCVPPDRGESNFKLVDDAFLSPLGVPKTQVHRVKGEMEPEKAAGEYEKDLRAFFGRTGIPVFDLIILGAGEDGHTASLFPGGTAAHERTRLSVPVYLHSPNVNRVTLTLPVLNHAAEVLFLLSGRSKAPVVHEIVDEGNPKQYPAGLVRPVSGTVAWMIDHDAASLLTGQVFRRAG